MKLLNGAVLLQPRPAYIEQIQKALPKAKRGVVQGKDTIAVKHDLQSTHTLREQGFDVPSPVLYTGWQFPGMYKPRDNQLHTTAFATLYKRAFILSEMRVGKTGASIWAAEYLIQHGFVKRVLVVCLKSCVHDVWENELFAILPHRSVASLTGSRERRQKELDKGTDFCIINHDGLEVFAEQVKIKNAAHYFCEGLYNKFDLIIFDEADTLCNHRTNLYESFKSLVEYTPWAAAKGHKLADYREPWFWLMTGTPTPTKYVDAWGLIKLVLRDKCPIRSWTQFRELMMVRVSQWKWVNKQGAKDILFNLMQPAIRFTQAQCFDLPKVQEVWRSVELSKEQKLLYRKMQKDGIIEREAGAISAPNAAVKVAKLLQISLGAVRDGFEAKVAIDARPRLSALREVLHELGVGTEENKKAVVFMPYTYVMEDVQVALEKMGFGVALINGNTPDWKRKELLTCFRSASCNVLVAHPETMAHGVDLTCAESIIWYGPCNGARFYQQGNQRHQGLKQKGHPAIVHLVATQLERERFKSLRDSTEAQENLLAMYEKALDEEV